MLSYAVPCHHNPIHRSLMLSVQCKSGLNMLTLLSCRWCLHFGLEHEPFLVFFVNFGIGSSNSEFGHVSMIRRDKECSSPGEPSIIDAKVSKCKATSANQEISYFSSFFFATSTSSSKLPRALPIARSSGTVLSKRGDPAVVLIGESTGL